MLFLGGECYGSYTVSIIRSKSNMVKATLEAVTSSKSLYIYVESIQEFYSYSCKPFSKHFPTNGICLLCKFNVATTSHCLMFCHEVRHVWKKSMFWNHLGKMKSTTFIFCGLVLTKLLKQEELELFTIMAWAVWVEF